MEFLTLVFDPLQAIIACAAGKYERTDYLVSLAKILDTRSQAFHHSGYLVPEHGRERKNRFSLHHVQVAVAYAAGANLNQNLALLWLGSLQLLDGERSSHPPKNSRFHISFPIDVSSTTDSCHPVTVSALLTLGSASA